MEMAEKIKTLKADSIYSAMSDEMKQHNINVEDVSRVLAAGYHFVGNGHQGTYDECFNKYGISFSQVSQSKWIPYSGAGASLPHLPRCTYHALST